MARFFAIALVLVLHLPLLAEDFRHSGPYHIGMSFQAFIDRLREEMGRGDFEINPRSALFRTHAPLTPFRVWTFTPFYIDPRLTEEFIFNDGRLVGMIRRERLSQSPLAAPPVGKGKTRADRTGATAMRLPAADEIGTPGASEPVELNEHGRELRDQLFKRFGPGKMARGRRGVLFSWKNDGIILTVALLISGDQQFQEKTVILENETRVLFTGAGDYRTNLEIEALNDRVFRTAPPGAKQGAWESGTYPYTVGPCEGYEGPLDLFGCTVRFDFGRTDKKSK